MQRWRGLEDIPEDWGRSVVTIGSYDGVHRGHQLIIGQAVDARPRAGRARPSSSPSTRTPARSCAPAATRRCSPRTTGAPS